MRLVFPIVLCLTVLVGCSRAGDVAPAADAVASDSTRVPVFDENRAFELLKKQVDIGPRYPNSPGHKAAAEFIQAQLKPYADGVRVQEFSLAAGGKTLKMQNILAHFNGKSDKWVLLAAHWDTRPIADCEVAAEKRKTPIPGANDGASGVAVLLELARMFASDKPDVGVFMVFFDGEDYGPGIDDMLLGSRYFARNLKASAAVDGKPIEIEYGILLDMVGDKNLNIHQERKSVDAAPEVVKKVWAAAKELGHRDKFIPTVKYQIQDDHTPLIGAGVKCIDVIDFDYGPWHTLDDTPDKCSAESLKVVGEVVAKVIYEEKGS